MVALVPRMRGWMSNGRNIGLKRWIFRCFTDPYTNFRTDTFEATSIDGLRFVGTLKGVSQRILYHFGIFEPNMSAFLREHLHPGDVYLDVGANIGYFSIYGARLVGPTGSVVAVEAAPATFVALQASLQRNGATNVRAINEAAFDSVSTLSLFTVEDEENPGGASVVKAVGPPIAEVPARPLADMLTADEIARTRGRPGRRGSAAGAAADAARRAIRRRSTARHARGRGGAIHRRRPKAARDAQPTATH